MEVVASDSEAEESKKLGDIFIVAVVASTQINDWGYKENS